MVGVPVVLRVPQVEKNQKDINKTGKVMVRKRANAS
jgi:competence protein ComGC